MIFYIGAETTMLFGAGRVLGPHRPASQLVYPKVKVDKIALKQLE
jgi:hypothetical protein